MLRLGSVVLIALALVSCSKDPEFLKRQHVLRGEPAYLVTLKLAKSDGVEEVLFALSCGAPVSFARVDAAPTKPH